jgi:hypothetical protein
MFLLRRDYYDAANQRWKTRVQRIFYMATPQGLIPHKGIVGRCPRNW